jgi:hypothetical protein
MTKRKRRDGPIADYIEWSQHRYDPGYYLGGRLPPHLRKASLGPHARRRAGLFLGVCAAMTLMVALSDVSIGPRWERFVWAGFALLTAWAAVTMYRSGRVDRGTRRR